MNTETPNNGSLRRLSQSYRVIDELRKLDPDLPSQAIATFIYVALNPGASVKQIADALGMLQATASRNVYFLSKTSRHNKPGLDLVRAVQDPQDRRFKQIHLTPRGRALLQSILGHLKD